MRELNMAWRLLKNVSSSDDYGDVSTALDDEERMKVEAIKRKNAEARKRMMEDAKYPNMAAEREAREARKRMMEHAKYPNMAVERGDDPKEIAQHHPSFQQPPVEIANIMDSPERMRRLNPTANFADGSAPPVPQNNPNPLDLSMESLKRLNEGR